MIFRRQGAVAVPRETFNDPRISAGAFRLLVCLLDIPEQSHITIDWARAAYGHLMEHFDIAIAELERHGYLFLDADDPQVIEEVHL